MNKRLIVIAESQELRLLRNHPELGAWPVLLTGAGPDAVLRALRDIPRDTEIVNLGFAGSQHFSLGDEVRVDTAQFWNPVAALPRSRTYHLAFSEGAHCYTSCDFVQGLPTTPPASVFDMELAFICALGFRKVKSYKTISDSLDYNQFKASNPATKHENDKSLQSIL